MCSSMRTYGIYTRVYPACTPRTRPRSTVPFTLKEQSRNLNYSVLFAPPALGKPLFLSLFSSVGHGEKGSKVRQVGEENYT